MPIIQEKCFGENKLVKKFGQIANKERGWSKEPNRFKTFGGENDKENTHLKGCRKFGDKKHNEAHEIENQKKIPIVYPTVDENFYVDPVQTFIKMPHNLGVQSVKPFAAIFKKSPFLPNLKIKINSNSSSRKIEAPDLMDFSFDANLTEDPDRFTPKTLDETWASFRTSFDQSLGRLDQSNGSYCLRSPFVDQAFLTYTNHLARIPGFRHCNKPGNSELINDSSGFDCNCSTPLVLDFYECLNWGRIQICVACNKSKESKLEQTQHEATQIPNSLDKTWNENLAEQTETPNSLDTTWNGTWSTTA